MPFPTPSSPGPQCAVRDTKAKKMPLKPKHSILVFPSPAAQVRPFRITLKADADEVGTTTAADMAATNEQSDAVSVLTKKEL